jgi:hypothetical protein
VYLSIFAARNFPTKVSRAFVVSSRYLMELTSTIRETMSFYKGQGGNSTIFGYAWCEGGLLLRLEGVAVVESKLMLVIHPVHLAH